VNQIVRLITWLYALMMHLYPRIFRVEFKEEMTAVFAQSAREAVEQGWLALTAVCLRELRQLPINLAREHWHSLTKKELSMIAVHKKPDISFYSAWIILSTLCVPVTFIICIPILIIITNIVGGYIYVDGVRHITEDYLMGYVFVPVAGLLMGALQYGLLRRYLPRMGWWVLVTTGGWLLGGLLALIPGWLNWTDAFFDLNMAIGLSIGVMQWLLLRRRLPGAGWWILANFAGWGLLGLTTENNTLGQFGLFGMGFLPACITTVTLALLMNHAQPSEPQGYTG
jgi:hypothetical protein